jgi:hypothetical protein
LVAICGVESGKAAALVGGPPGIVLQTVLDETPSGVTGATAPVLLATRGVAIAPSGLAVVVVPGGVGAVETDGVVPMPVPVAGVGVAADMEVTVTVGVPGEICPVGVEHVTTVPGVEGSEANGTGASVVTGAPGWVVAENGLGPLSGEVTIVPGVDGMPMAVVPMVETCARPGLQPNSRTAAVANSKRCIAIACPPRRSSLPASCARPPCCLPPGSPSD